MRDEKEPLDKPEIELLAIFRTMSKDQRKYVLKLIRAMEFLEPRS